MLFQAELDEKERPIPKIKLKEPRECGLSDTVPVTPTPPSETASHRRLNQGKVAWTANAEISWCLSSPLAGARA